MESVQPSAMDRWRVDAPESEVNFEIKSGVGARRYNSWHERIPDSADPRHNAIFLTPKPRWLSCPWVRNRLCAGGARDLRYTRGCADLPAASKLVAYKLYVAYAGVVRVGYLALPSHGGGFGGARSPCHRLGRGRWLPGHHDGSAARLDVCHLRVCVIPPLRYPEAMAGALAGSARAWWTGDHAG